MTLRVMDAAERCCDGRVVVFLEGGYDPDRTGAGCVSVVRALAGIPNTAGRDGVTDDWT